MKINHYISIVYSNNLFQKDAPLRLLAEKVYHSEEDIYVTQLIILAVPLVMELAKGVK